MSIPLISSDVPVYASESVFSDESAAILQQLKKINTGCFFRSDRVLVNKLKLIDPVELTRVLKYFFMEMVQEDRITDPVKFLDRLATVIPLAKMQEAVKDDVENALKEAKGMFEEARLYLQMTHGNTSSSIRVHILSVLNGIISVIESIITAFGIGDFFKPAESDLQADFKSQKIMMLLHLFGMITAMILPLLGASTGGLIIGGTLLGIAALSAIWPLIKPRTIHLPANAENWTQYVQKRGFVAQGRKESLDEIANIIKMNRHAILVGPSRVGKSLTAKAFAQAVERGDYPELKGKVVFRINTTDLVGQTASFLGGGNDILNKISAAMGRHRNDIILVLDEIHMACKNNEKLADQLKTFLDEDGEFPHVIGITTEEEYDKHVKDNNAFSLRFDRVDIKNTSQDETLKILGDTLLRNRSKPLMKEGALNQIYAK
ncbi:MAG: AAA family ATPase, partial [Chlamydiia bacterium]|nr:AAA family ATPase [Chlamydiia bacterium]